MRVKLQGVKREQGEQEIEREEHWSTAFTESLGCGNGSRRVGGVWELHECYECKVELRGSVKKLRKETRGLK